MSVSLPTPTQLLEVAKQCGLSLTDEDVASFRGLMRGSLDAYNLVAAMPDELPVVKYPRTPGYRPSPDENTRNAWYRKTNIKGAGSGKLKGKTVALKDNIMLAGVPMMNGSATLEGYVPDFDATIVTRMLDAGAEIVGKVHCEAFCLSGGSHTNATGPVHNPHKMGYSAGGSSSGSGVVVALREVDIAIGGDQGGSIRMPSSFCGTYGMKPTWGLVPYTGIMPIEIFIDHTGPITATVADNALLLEVIAGDDGYDSRIKAPKVDEYTKALGAGIKGMKIGILKEGFEQPSAEAAVNESVREAAKRFKDLGATVEIVSIPMHLLGAAIWTPIGTEGAVQTMMFGDGYGLSRGDLYPTSLMDFHRGWRQKADSLSETNKLFMLWGTYINNTFGSRFYGKALNISRRLATAYDKALESYDLLLMPTTPMKATPLPPSNASREDYFTRAIEMFTNTAPFDITHHPAMSLPCGMVDGLPVGLMLVGRHFEESTIYRAAHAFEQIGDWKKM
ncbi:MULTISPECIES: amidase [Bradyrhizobium]|uniref:Indoleacetamide hydrolase n=3 Tax=Bradyrhizobium TaxID=374 RepID=A0A410VJH9_9BRAD|nr:MULTISPECIES: amidase [Bradyrhizobium]MCG2631978.1 amidase [Bradyrhizobium zhengyangense]MCG2645033.1 amidase [Bradyrhizobium zhengyangense]MCG2672771.1 amidase [Bradyrhizobium zhengyangense]MDN4985378.1 amidase [Bradyrhizobium sp. WYCCWR 13022]MDN5002391.1 amidase [Bradyrhizobium sp. WYCCWR 12677]